MRFRKKLRIMTFMVCGFITMLSYQNCSPLNSKDAGSTTASSGQELTNQKAMTILTTRCSSCHDANTKAGGVDVLNIEEMLARGVIVPNEPNLSALFNDIQSGRMPPAKALSQSEMQAVYNWIQDGFKDPQAITTPPPPTTVPLAATYNSINTNILKTKCLGCHNSSKSDGGISFSTYTSTMNTVQKTLPLSSALYTAVATRKTMPKSSAALPIEETKAISDWITAGANNN